MLVYVKDVNCAANAHICFLRRAFNCCPAVCRCTGLQLCCDCMCTSQIVIALLQEACLLHLNLLGMVLELQLDLVACSWTVLGLN